jgi:4-hydroxybenzoate polyprenyltransferase
MRLFFIIQLFCGFSGIINIASLKINHNYNRDLRLGNVKENNNPSEKYSTNISFKNKLKELVQLIRPKSIVPTLFLCGAGGFIMNPSIPNLIFSKTFITSTASTILILSSSMVINDIYDVKIDKINNPGRPIASGKIKKYEAILLYLSLIGSTEAFSIYFLPEAKQDIINFFIFLTSIYTPLLKRIPLLKNIVCAWIVSFTLFFSGLSSSPNQFAIQNNNFGILSIAMSLVFYGSLSNEILLDIKDYDGDKANKIYTLPVLFGKKFSLICTSIITNLNIMSNSLALMYITGNNTIFGLLLAVICSPISFNLFKLKNNDYSENEISKVVNETNKPLFLMLLYLCIISLLSNSSKITFFI